MTNLIHKDIVVLYCNKDGSHSIYHTLKDGLPGGKLLVQKIDNDGNLMNKKFECLPYKLIPLWLQPDDRVIDTRTHKAAKCTGYMTDEKVTKKGAAITKTYINHFTIVYDDSRTQEWISFDDAVGRLVVVPDKHPFQ